MIGMKTFIFLFIVMVSLPVLVTSQLDLPPGIQQIKEYNVETANFYLKNLSFPLAFIAGVLSFISPCIVPLIPAFFAYSFKEKKNLTKMTFIFFIGFATIFVTMGLVASYLGQSLITFQQNYSSFILFAGIFLIIFGLMSLFGKGFSSFIKINKRFKNDVPGIFSFGLVFALGWTACLGPILAGILLVASILGSYLNAALLLFVYSLGIALPLFIFSFVYDKYDLSKNRFIRGKVIEFNFSRRNFRVHSTNLIAGFLFLIIGSIFVIFRNTNIFITTIGGSTLFYEFQRKIMSSSSLFNIVGLIILVVFIILLLKFLVRR